MQLKNFEQISDEISLVYNRKKFLLVKLIKILWNS